MEPKSNIHEAIINRLNILICLVLEQSSLDAALSTSDKIGKLADLGVSTSDIARILGKRLNYVTATLSQRKSRKKKLKAHG